MANEKRLIDADVLFDELIKKQYSAESMGILHTEYPNMRAIVAKQPTVDAVEVVRCKDCKHYKPRNQSVHWEQTTPCCTRSACLKFPPDGFCSYGERKDNE